jgi:hypothetical protein
VPVVTVAHDNIPVCDKTNAPTAGCRDHARVVRHRGLVRPPMQRSPMQRFAAYGPMPQVAGARPVTQLLRL